MSQRDSWAGAGSRQPSFRTGSSLGLDCSDSSSCGVGVCFAGARVRFALVGAARSESKPAMNKRQLIDDIRKFNTTVQPQFLAQFDEMALKQYLEHLEGAFKK